MLLPRAKLQQMSMLPLYMLRPQVSFMQMPIVQMPEVQVPEVQMPVSKMPLSKLLQAYWLPLRHPMQDARGRYYLSIRTLHVLPVQIVRGGAALLV